MPRKKKQSYREVYDEILNQAIDRVLKKVPPDKREKAAEHLVNKFDDFLQESIPKVAELQYREIKKSTKIALQESHAYREGFEKRLYKRWCKAFDSLENMIDLAVDTGSNFYKDYSKRHLGEKDPVFIVLNQLHSRACRIAQEVLALMKAGFGVAAFARWRALHEVVVVASFLKDQGERAAYLYLEHEIIQAYQAMQEYGKHKAMLGGALWTKAEKQRLQSQYYYRKKKYGKKFLGQYGWAAVFLGKERSGFQDIEKLAGVQHLRPYYRLASHGIHANIKGLHNSDVPKGVEVHLTGGSDFGFADPGQCTAISIHQMTLTFLFYEVTVFALVTANVQQRLLDQTKDNFVDCHRRYLRRYPKRKKASKRKHTSSASQRKNH